MDFSVAKRHSRNPSAELKKFRKKKSTRPDKKKDPILRLIEKDSTMFKTKTLKERTQGSHINIKENIQGLGQKRLSLPIRLRSGSGWFGQDSRASDPVARKNKENIVKRKKIGNFRTLRQPLATLSNQQNWDDSSNKENLPPQPNFSGLHSKVRKSKSGPSLPQNSDTVSSSSSTQTRSSSKKSSNELKLWRDQLARSAKTLKNNFLGPDENPVKQCGQEIIAGSHPHVQERQLWIEETSQDRERKSDAFDSKPRGAEKFSDYFRRHRNGSKQLEKNLFEAQYDYNEQILILPDPDGIREHHFRKNEIPVILSDDDPPDDIYDNSSQDDQHMVHVVVDHCSPSLCRPVQLQDIVHDGNRTLAYVSPILFQNRFEPEDPWEEKYLPAIPVDKNYEEIFYHEDDCDLRALNSVSNHETENLLRLQDSPSTGFPCLAQNDLDRLLPDPESSFSADISSGIYGFEIVNEISNQEEEGVDVLSEAVRLSLSFSSEHFDEREGHGEFRPKMSNLQFDEDYNAGIDEELDPGDVFHLSSNYNAKNSNRHVTSPQLSLSPLPTFDALIRDDKVSINAQDIVPNNFSLDEETSDELLELLSRDLNDSENPMFNDLESRNPLRTGNLDPGLKARSSCLDPSAMISLDQLHQSGEDFFPVDSSVVDIEFLEQDDDGTLIDSKTWSEDTLPRRFWRDDN